MPSSTANADLVFDSDDLDATEEFLVRNYTKMSIGGDARPAALRKAIAFIDDNVQSDITLVDIAAAVYVTPRTLADAAQLSAPISSGPDATPRPTTAPRR